MIYYRVLICGDRNWTNRKSIRALLQKLMKAHPGYTIAVCHGGQGKYDEDGTFVSGADTIAGQEAAKLGLPVARMDANWNFFQKRAGPIRNQWMLDLWAPHEVHGFHADIRKSKGTADMLERAAKSRDHLRDENNPWQVKVVRLHKK